MICNNINPLVSIIIPAYNHEQFIVQAVNSIAQQDYSNIELIVIDDGSTDRTAVLAELALEDSKCRYYFLRQKNHGAPATINRALSFAKGDYITILNSDDYFLPSRVSSLVSHAHTSHASFIFTQVTHVDQAGASLTLKHPLVALYQQALATTQLLPIFEFKLLEYNLGITSGNFFFTRSLINNLQGFAPYFYVHDWDFLLRAVLITKPLFLSERSLCYRVHNTNTIHKIKSDRANLENEILDILKNYLTHAESAENDYAPNKKNWRLYWEHFYKRNLLYL